MPVVKKIAGFLVYGILLCFVLAAFAISFAFYGAKNSVPVLNYHQINNEDVNALTVSVEDFDAQMKYLAQNGYTSITPNEMLAAFENGETLPEKTVVITFDDGYLDNYLNAYPILQKYNLKGTMFVITDYVSLYPNYITWDEAVEMQESGVMNLESHTMGHINLLKSSKEEAIFQLKTSKDALEAHLKKPVEFLAYPEGDYDDEIEKIAKDTKYKGAFTVNYDLTSKEEDPFALSRVPIFGMENRALERFKLRVTMTPVFSPLNKFKRKLESIGLDIISDHIYIP